MEDLNQYFAQDSNYRYNSVTKTATYHCPYNLVLHIRHAGIDVVYENDDYKLVNSYHIVPDKFWPEDFAKSTRGVVDAIDSYIRYHKYDTHFVQDLEKLGKFRINKKITIGVITLGLAGLVTWFKLK
jgi:hypothetical protein